MDNKRLIPVPKYTNLNRLRDLINSIAVTIEDLLLASGAVPIQDYNHDDIYRQARPLAIRKYTYPQARIELQPVFISERK